MSHDAIQERLLEHLGPLDDELAAHLEACEECRALAETLREVDGGVRGVIAPPIPDDLIARTMARIADEKPPAAPSIFALFGGLLAGLFGGLWAIVKLFALPFATSRARRRTLWLTIPSLAVIGLAVFSVTLSSEDDLATRDGAFARLEDSRDPTGSPEAIAEPPADLPVAPNFLPDTQTRSELRWQRDDQSRARGFEDEETNGQARTSTVDAERGRYWSERDGDDLTVDRRGELDGRDLHAGTDRIDLAEEVRRAPPEGPAEGNIVPTELEGLAFVEPHGYWANTYLPGDPEVRTLRRQLSGATLQFAERASPDVLGVDAPRDGAIAVSVRADRASVEGRSRVMMAVVGSSRVDLQACKLEYSIVSPK